MALDGAFLYAVRQELSGLNNFKVYAANDLRYDDVRTLYDCNDTSRTSSFLLVYQDCIEFILITNGSAEIAEIKLPTMRHW